jgi:hypothetical protein
VRKALRWSEREATTGEAFRVPVLVDHLRAVLHSVESLEALAASQAEDLSRQVAETVAAQNQRDAALARVAVVERERDDALRQAEADNAALLEEFEDVSTRIAQLSASSTPLRAEFRAAMEQLAGDLQRMSLQMRGHTGTRRHPGAVLLERLRELERERDEALRRASARALAAQDAAAELGLKRAARDDDDEQGGAP